MKITVTAKLYIGFIIAFIVAGAIGLTSYMTFQKQAEEARWVRHTYQVINSAQTIQNLMINMETGRRAFRITDDKRFLQPYDAGNASIHPAINELKQLVTDNPKEEERAEKLETEIDQELAYWGGKGEDASKYTRQDIINITDTEKRQMDAIRATIKNIMKEEDELLQQRELESNASVHNASLSAAVGTALVQVIILVLIYMIVAEFRNRRKAEQALQDNLAKLERLNKESNDQNWMLTGMSHVNTSMQGINDVASLVSLLLQQLVKYLAVPAGALYIYDDEEQKLVRRASVALPENAIAVFKLGEGIIGAAGSMHDVTLIKDVPAGYWSLASGSGMATAGQVLCLPLWYNDELKGVIELASFKPFTELDINLLQSISNNIAIAINAADAREKIMLLLEQVQKQKDSLQQQEEELRQSNEELRQQAEILQASEEELKVQEEELRQINAELEEKNEAVEIASQSLAAKARELEITGRYKSEFLANMSHELRTPLNSVMILAKLMAENKTHNLTEKQVEYANIIHRSGNDLLNLINDILDLSKIEAGRIDLNFEQIEVKRIVEDLRQLFYVLAEEKSITFKQFIDDNVPEKILTDKLRLEQIVKNLLSNAFKFTPRGGNVSLLLKVVKTPAIITSDELKDLDNLLAISVADTGIGISPDKQQIIFEPFQQADGSTSRKFGGTGLGLSISKELIRKLGGEIKLESEEGKGSTFIIYLPLNARISYVPGAPKTEDAVIPLIDENVYKQHSVPDDRHAITAGDKVMLIVEDDVTFAKTLQAFAHDNGYKSIVALQGDEGLYYASKYRPAAIILDIQLPVVDGRTFLKTLKSNSKLKNIPVHVISAYDESVSSAPGAIAYLKKPVEKENLDEAFALIEEYISSGIKKVLVLSGDYLKDNSLQRAINDRRFDIDCDYCFTEEEAIVRIKEKKYDCLIADIGKDIGKGIKMLMGIKSFTEAAGTPIIIYMDNELSPSDELELKKVTDIIIHESSHAKERLMDELELFLYKVQHDERVSLPRSKNPIADDKILKGKKVLLADDDVRNVFALNTLLEDQQMVVYTAADGKEAINAMQEHPDMDIVLMDIMMPEMDGYEAIKKLRNEQRFLKLPIIALTAKAMQGDRRKAIEAGASDYISKPIDNNRLLSLMRVWLS